MLDMNYSKIAKLDMACKYGQIPGSKCPRRGCDRSLLKSREAPLFRPHRVKFAHSTYRWENKTLPFKHHRFCCQHLWAIFKLAHGKGNDIAGVKQWLWKAAKARAEPEARQAMEELGKISLSACNWFTIDRQETRRPEYWSE